MLKCNISYKICWCIFSLTVVVVAHNSDEDALCALDPHTLPFDQLPEPHRHLDTIRRKNSNEKLFITNGFLLWYLSPGSQYKLGKVCMDDWKLLFFEMLSRRRARCYKNWNPCHCRSYQKEVEFTIKINLRTTNLIYFGTCAHKDLHMWSFTVIQLYQLQLILSELKHIQSVAVLFFISVIGWEYTD